MPVKEHGFLFTGEMVRALLEGRKWQTRRLVTRHNSIVSGRGGSSDEGRALWARLDWTRTRTSQGLLWVALGDASAPDVPAEIAPSVYVMPRVQSGHGIWVKETWTGDGSARSPVMFRASEADDLAKWKSALLMPRWASRLEFVVQAARGERLQDLTEAGAVAEGVANRSAFAALWASLHAEPGTRWEDNPAVWVYEFSSVSNNPHLT